MKIFTIDSVRLAINKYRKQDSYIKCCEDLCGFFTGKTMETIFSEPMKIFENGKDFRYIKSRIESSDNNKGQSNGYRIYYFVDRLKEEVYIISFYPKTGKYKKVDVSTDEEKNFISEFKEQRKNNKLREHDVNKAFDLKHA